MSFALKLSNDDRIALLKLIYPEVVKMAPTTAPPNKNGDSKVVRRDLAAAAWTKRYIETLEYVLENDGRQGNESKAPGTSAAPW